MTPKKSVRFLGLLTQRNLGRLTCINVCIRIYKVFTLFMILCLHLRKQTTRRLSPASFCQTRKYVNHDDQSDLNVVDLKRARSHDKGYGALSKVTEKSCNAAPSLMSHDFAFTEGEWHFMHLWNWFRWVKIIFSVLKTRAVMRCILTRLKIWLVGKIWWGKKNDISSKFNRELQFLLPSNP